MRRPDPTADDPVRAGWNAACRLYEYLAGGGSMMPLPLDAVRLEPGEDRYGDTILGYARYYGTSVTYQQTSSLWFGSPAFVLGGLAATSLANTSARRRAEGMAAAQWRDQAMVRVKLTDRRFLCDYMGNWLSFWHDGVVELSADIARLAFIVRYQEGHPLMLHGPPAPWFALAAATFIYGARGYQLPAFAPLAQAIAQHRTITGEVTEPGGSG